MFRRRGLTVEPYASSMLEVGDGHSVYWEECGNPRAPAVLFVHGGPGGGSQIGDRGFFDPRRWRIILFDQRGAGRSRPLGETRANTTRHLVADMEALRRHLNVHSWTLFGGSWGATLSLAYAQAHRSACASMILRAVFLGSAEEVDWFFNGMGRFHPEAWRKFVGAIPETDRGDILGAYLRRLMDSDAAVHLPAALAWCEYEAKCSSLKPNPSLEAVTARPEVAVPMARLEAHYMSANAFMAPGALLAGVDEIRDVPCTIVHGRHDLVCPMGYSADLLSRAWPEAELVIVPDAGHSSADPPLRVALLAAAERHAALRHAEERSMPRRQGARVRTRMEPW